MKKLLIFIFAITLLACNKDKNDDKLPRDLGRVVGDLDCDCKPEVAKIKLEGRIYYVLHWRSPDPACNRPPIYYNTKGDETRPIVTIADGSADDLGTVWTCEP